MIYIWGFFVFYVRILHVQLEKPPVWLRKSMTERSARFSSAGCMTKNMHDLYQPSHRGDRRQGDKLKGIKGKSVLMLNFMGKCGGTVHQALRNEPVVAGGSLRMMTGTVGIWENGIWRV